VARWAHPMKVELANLDRLGEFIARVAARPAVQQALQAEGLTHGEAKRL